MVRKDSFVGRQSYKLCFFSFHRIIASVKEYLPKVDADVGVNSNDVDRNDSSLDEQVSDSDENGEEGQQKKKHKKEKIGFRDRKVWGNPVVVYDSCWTH